MRSVIAIVVLLFTARPLLCQLLIPAGQSVRITSSRYDLRSRLARVLRATPDTVMIQTRGARTRNYREAWTTDTLTIPVAAIDRLEVNHGGGNHAKSGAMIGFGIGAVAGIAVGSLTYQECRPADSWQCSWAKDLAGMQILGYGLLFGGIGTAVGAIVGGMIPGDRWEALPLRAASVRALPHSQIGLVFTAAFP
jgi:hypothetical protein